MSFWEVVLLVILAVLAGGLAQVFSGFSVIGFIFSVCLGLAGALAGGWAAREFDLPEVIIIGDMNFVIWPIIGAVLFTALFSVLNPRKAD